ncbi:hypothetical protein [Natrarchaeobaculum sulfurireducens]|uniref:TRAM domain-containing protein n=1 Tax=Natrarchaeobaculum sulfurireducens TaxID=2044521 RepID=A0A346PRL7_9EURY|nr:hypothetical protein [Natrarchaeobaculum sulfurireducens]AXR77855.1 hypothetical protein AArc1_1522 [Natrarchaeobaculum sulfurireducens]AXR82162.1 hypothetical protein AArcMg_2164 [Natrarchaeobaculum sulfurireducens]
MTSIRNPFDDVLWIGETVEVTLEDQNDSFVAEHPNEASPLGLVVVDGLEHLENQPPDGPVSVEIVASVVDGRIAARLLEQ